MSVDFYAGRKFDDGSIGWVDGTLNSSVNMSNSVAARILELIGVDTTELIGELSFSQVRNLIDKLDNPDAQIAGYQDGRIISMGRNLDQMRDYAHHLETLLDVAEQYEAEFIYYV